ncbi:MAG: sulfite exporter TauE/SafE family protein [Propionibacteriaceae bacterium]|nr:sulfite exporter TauE/SafE family protein [Propionibacteriaceae bacterium]
MTAVPLSAKQLAIRLALGLAAGALSGLFGVGGGVIIVPLLVLVCHLAQRRAQATSLTSIVMIAAVGAVPYLLRSGVSWPAVAIIAVGGLAGSVIGSSLVQHINEDWLKVCFAVVALAAAIQLVLPKAAGGADRLPALSIAVVAGYLGAGLVMGVLSPLVGVGGGIVLVPILVFFMGFPQPVAQGMSLLVLVPVSLVGSARGALAHNVDWQSAIGIGVGGAIASPIAAHLALNMPTALLKALFAALLAVVAFQIGINGVRSLRRGQARPR